MTLRIDDGKKEMRDAIDRAINKIKELRRIATSALIVATLSIMLNVALLVACWKEFS